MTTRLLHTLLAVLLAVSSGLCLAVGVDSCFRPDMHQEIVFGFTVGACLGIFSWQHFKQLRRNARGRTKL